MTKEKLSASLTGIFLLSAGVLSLEISLTRVFSAVLRYHFVFLVVSIAVCGLGLGAMIFHFLKKTGDKLLGITANLAGWSTILFMFVFLRFILPIVPEALWLITLFAILPFIFAGIYLADLFTRRSKEATLLYAFDLVGAGIASFLSIIILDLVGAVNACLISAAIIVSAGFINRKTRIFSGVSIVIIILLLGTNIKFLWLNVPALPTKDTTYAKALFTELGKDSKIEILHTEWDSFARTDVVKDPAMGDNILLVYTNGHVPTRLIRYFDDSGKYALEPNIADVPFEFQQPEKVLCIGPGGGMDVLLANKNGAKIIDGVEINPAIEKIMQLPKTIKFAGEPYGITGVRLFTADGRTFVKHTKNKYDMIFLSLAKTGTGTFGIALVEGYIYTVEAFLDYLKKLTPDGSIVFVTDGYLMNIRLFATALSAVMRQGKSLAQALEHIALFSVQQHERGHNPYEYALIISKSPLSPDQKRQLVNLSGKKKYIPLFIPGKIVAPDFQPLYHPKATLSYFLSCFYNTWKADLVKRRNIKNPDSVPLLNLMPVTDNQPFFLDFSFGIPQMLIPLLVGAIAVILILGIGLYCKEIFSQRENRNYLSQPILYIFAYFTFLGMAFMMIEIPLIQEMILVLGHPAYALSVVLFTLLSGAGIGSYISGLKYFKNINRMNQFICLITAFFSFILVLYMNSSHEGVLALPLPGRIAWGGGISMGIGFFLGMPFPYAMRALGEYKVTYISWMWGVNGISSVLGSILAAIGSKLMGFHFVFMTGALIYLFAAICASHRWKD